MDNVALYTIIPNVVVMIGVFYILYSLSKINFDNIIALIIGSLLFLLLLIFNQVSLIIYINLIFICIIFFISLFNLQIIPLFPFRSKIKDTNSNSTKFMKISKTYLIYLLIGYTLFTAYNFFIQKTIDIDIVNNDTNIRDSIWVTQVSMFLLVCIYFYSMLRNFNFENKFLLGLFFIVLLACYSAMLICAILFPSVFSGLILGILGLIAGVLGLIYLYSKKSNIPSIDFTQGWIWNACIGFLMLVVVSIYFFNIQYKFLR